MVGPSSQISKLLLVLLILIIFFYIYMDYNLYDRIQNYPLDRTDLPATLIDNTTINYKDATWLGCDISPLCDVTVKAVLLDHTNYYLFAPLVTLLDNILKISETEWITPNSISFFHVFVAILSAKCISSDSLSYRRVGVLLFEVRTFLDDLDGHVARARKHIKGERSEVGTSGYYIDGLCDALGCTALIIGIFIYLKNNPPRRGYMQLPTVSDSKDLNVQYKTKITTSKVAKTVLCFAAQLIISSAAWNRYIATYQYMLEGTDVTPLEIAKQNDVFKSSLFFSVAWLWRVINVHNMVHLLLLMIFCDKLWEFLRNVQYIGFGILLSVICITEIHIVDVKHFIYHVIK